TQHQTLFQPKQSAQPVPALLEKTNPLVQSVLYELLYDCYDLLYQLSQRMDPIAPSLLPLHTKLLGLKRCLNELWEVHLSPASLLKIEKSVPSSCSYLKKSKLKLPHVEDLRIDLERVLIPLRMQLNAIDNLRVDGK